MGQLSYNMLGAIFSVTVLPAFICMGIGAYVLASNPQSAKNRVFFFYNLIIGLVGFFDFEFRTATGLSEALLWGKAQSIWPFIVAAPLHFSILICQKSDQKKSIFPIILLYISAAAACVVILISDLFLNSPIHGKYGWYSNFTNNIYSLIILAWAISIAVFAISLPYYAAKKEKRYLQRKQLRYIFTAYFFGYGIGLLFGLYIPAFGHRLIELDKVGMAISNIIIAYAVIKTGLFEYSAQSIADTVFKTMPAAEFTS